MAKLTKQQRIAAHMAAGLSAVDAEIAIVREDADAKLKGLRQRAAREAKAQREKALSYIETAHPEVFAEAMAAATAGQKVAPAEQAEEPQPQPVEAVEPDPDAQRWDQ